MPPEFFDLFLSAGAPDPSATIGIDDEDVDDGTPVERPTPQELAEDPDVQAILEAAATLPN